MTICKPGRAPLPPFPETRSVCTLILYFPPSRTKLWKRMFVAYATQMVFCYSSLGVANTIKESQEKQLGNSLRFFYITTDNLLLHHWKLLKLSTLGIKVMLVLLWLVRVWVCVHESVWVCESVRVCESVCVSMWEWVVCMCKCVLVWVCMCERVWLCMHVWVSVWVSMWVCGWVYESVSVRVFERMGMSVCVWVSVGECG
jgi:hypothetical protein